MKIDILAAEKAEGSALIAAIEKCKQYADADGFEIICKERVPQDAEPYKHPGWLEYMIVIKWGSGRTFVLGMIQRNIDERFEFHS